MRIPSLQTAYTQKSKLFLYPLLNIKRGSSVTPIQTYLQWSGYYTTDDCKLIAHYYLRDDPEFKSFEEKFLLNNKYFEEFFDLEDGTGAYVFDLSNWGTDYTAVVEGKYSSLSAAHKSIISDFFSNHPKHHVFILSYLNPHRFISDYAELLGVSPELLQKVGELCSVPDMKKETFQLFKKNTNFDLLNLTNTKDL